jgi:protein-S-isoprenylcysteine O-methyltransferase Ste14
MPHPFYGPTVPHTLIIGSWVVFIAYWFVSSFFAKRSVRGQKSWFGVNAFRMGLMIAILAFLRLPWARTHLGWQPDLGLFWPWVGAALTLVGITLAVWARVYLGRNWGMPQTLRRDHELVSSGAYQLVRHPIYAGILLALLGTALAYGPFWFIILFGAGAFFVYSTYVEERDLCARFPDAYRRYRARTKRLVPFIW